MLLHKLGVQYYEGLTARAGNRIYQSVSTAHYNIKTSITVSLIAVQQLFAAATVSLYHDNTAISYCFSLTQFVVLVMFVWWVGPNSTSGIVEFCNNNLWGLIAKPGWSDNNAGVICKQLGLERGEGHSELVIMVRFAS